jgi:transcriptional regulator of nitric oxide reductase
MGGQASINTYAASANSSEKGKWLPSSASLSVSLVAGKKADKYTQIVLTQGFTPFKGMGAKRGPYFDKVAVQTANTTVYKVSQAQKGAVRTISPYLVAR